MNRPGAGTVLGGPGTAIFTGGGWLQAARDESVVREEAALILSDPCRVLVARTVDEVAPLLDEISTEQARGRHVAGCVTYEAGASFGLSVKTPDLLPLAWMAAYPEESVRRLSRREWASRMGAVHAPRVAQLVAAAKPKLSVSQPEFVRAINSIKELIAAGDTYQVNYTVRAGFRLEIDPLDYFLALVLRQHVPYAAFFDLGESQFLSLSPELFLRRQGIRLESMPMKGTRPRNDNPAEDAAIAYELLRSEKDRAENLMIVDMVRNDLGRVSRAGSIHVPALFAVEPYRTVWQMVSTVTGRVRRDATVREIVAATFPGASITGAPKHHTMEIINRLETEPRGVYTGTMGLFLPGGDFTCNLAIRTLAHKRGFFTLGVGAGIVWDSDPEEEYQETLTKAAFALPPAGSRWEPLPARERARAASIGLFETLLLDAAGGAKGGGGSQERTWPSAAPGGPPGAGGVRRYRFLREHLERMERSARALQLPFDRATAEHELAEFAADTDGAAVVRLDLDVGGQLELVSRPAPSEAQAPVALMVSPFRTDPYDPLLVHKTTNRHLYDRERERAVTCGCHEALFMNYLGRVTEGAITNVFCHCGGSWVTPPVNDGLLPGIWREGFIRTMQAVERSLTLEDLLAADEIVIGNSVRGAIRVDCLRVDCPAW